MRVPVPVLKRWLPGLLAAALGIGLWLLLGNPLTKPARPASGASSAPGTSAARKPWALFAQELSSIQNTSLRIRGTVRGPKGPVAGAEVLASAPVQGESLSSLPCDVDESETLLDCFGGSNAERLSTLVTNREGEVPVLARTTSAEDGSFTLEGLDAGRYMLWAEHAEGTGLGHDVSAGAEGVELRLGPSVRLTGTIRDEKEAPVPGALVTAIFKTHSRFFEAVTDASGNYALGPIPKGEYVLHVFKEGLMPESDRFTGYVPEAHRNFFLLKPRTLSGQVLRHGAPVADVEVSLSGVLTEPRKVLTDASGRFSFAGLWPLRNELVASHGNEGASTSVEFDQNGALERSDITLELRPITYLRGVVRDTRRQPIEGAELSINIEQEDDSTWVSARSDAEGHYQLGPLEPGASGSLTVRARGFQEWEQQVAVGTEPIDVALEPRESVEGLVLDAEGLPLPNVTVDLWRTQDSEPRSHVVRANTARDGRFSLGTSKPGPYQLEVSSQNEPSRTLEVSAPASGIVIRYAGPVVKGEVVDATGLPLPGVTVALLTASEARNQRILEQSHTETDGRFSLTPSKVGRYVVAAELSRDDFARTVSQTVEVGPGVTSVRLGFGEGTGLSGVVVDRRGQPIKGARVKLDATPVALQADGCSGPFPGALTDAEGHFRFQEVSGDAFSVKVDLAGYELDTPDREPVIVRPEGKPVRLVLRRLADVVGRVVDETGAPIAEFSVNRRGYFSEQGMFRFRITRGGEQSIEVSATGYRPVRRTVILQEEKNLELGTIALEKE